MVSGHDTRESSSIQAFLQAGSCHNCWSPVRRRPSRDAQQYPEASAIKGKEMRYAVIIEKSATGYGAHVPDLPGCVATAATVEEVEGLIREAIDLHLAGLQEDGCSIPAPSTLCEYVESRSQVP